MAQEIDKIIKSTTPPKSKDVLWDNGKELLINRNGKWESANSTEIKEGSIPLSALANDVKDKIENAGDGADWNAQEGEAGYIENRPCYVNLNNGHRITLDNADITLSSDENWYEKIIIPIQEGRISLYFYNLNEELIHYVLTEGQSVFDYHFGCKFTAVLNEYDTCDLLLTDFGDPKEYVDNTFAKIKIVYDYNDTVIGKLNSVYLPYTVLKTTPQELSNADKNQALTNLGIDPVVWKYLCSPCIIERGYKVPEELIGEYSDDVGDEGGYYLKYPNLGMYKIIFTNERIDIEYGTCSVGLSPSNVGKKGFDINDIYISPDFGTMMGTIYIDKNKNWYFSY